MRLLFVFAGLAVILFDQQCLANQESLKYLVYAPNTFHQGRTEKIYFEFNTTRPVNVFVFVKQSYIENNTYLTETSGVIDLGVGTIDIEIPSNLARWWYGSLNFEAQIVGTKDVVNGSREIRIRNIRPVTFVELDKPIYKPGQTVRFRILTINEQIMPLLDSVPKVIIESPSQTRLAKWTDIETEDGLVDLEFELAEEPSLGAYTIFVYPPQYESRYSWEPDYITKKFTVDEYVLPKYEITATTPKGFLLINEENYQFTICGKYTYGQPVRGRIDGRLRAEERYGFTIDYSEPDYFFQPAIDIMGNNNEDEERKGTGISFQANADEDGCANFDLDVTSLRLNSSDFYYYRKELYIDARFTEAGTGNTFKDSFKPLTLENRFLFLEFKCKNAYKPGIPFNVELHATTPDGKAGAGEVVTVTAKYGNTPILEGNYTTNGDGIIRFSLNTSSVPPSERIVLNAFTFKYPTRGYVAGFNKVYDATAYKSVQPSFSPSGRFIQLEPINEKLIAGTTQGLRVFYTSDDESVADNFVFKFIARGNIEDAIVTRPQSRKKRESPPEPVEPFERVESECEKRIRESKSEELLVGAEVPKCREDGSFEPKQCSGSTGYCWCVNEEGEELEGTKKGPGQTDEVLCEELGTSPEPITFEPLILDFTLEPPIEHATPQTLRAARFSFKVIPDFSPTAKLIVYYVSDDGEVIADSLNFQVHNAYNNEVSVDFSSPEQKPGTATKLKINARGGSLCAVGIVDKSVNVLGGDHQFTGEKIFQHFRQYDLYRTFSYNFGGCSSRTSRLRYKRAALKNRRKRSDYFYPSYRRSYKDSKEAFYEAGLIVMSNYDLDVAPCTPYAQPDVYYSFRNEGPGEPVAMSRTDTDFEVDDRDETTATAKEEDKIRSFFPETWLWSLKRIGEETSAAEFDLHVPHTITDWVASGFCTSSRHGVGIAEKTFLRAFQPFFLSLNLPYSIIRTEKVPIKISVFNYLDQCLVVRVTMHNTEGNFELLNKAEQDVAVPAGESVVVTYMLFATTLGDIPITVSAVSIDDANDLCNGDSGPADASDGVRRTVLVKPEGEPASISESGYFCLEEGDSYSSSATLELPNTFVQDTPRGEVTVTGDLIGNTLQNTDNLIRMPYGCGEQNIVSMVPNIVALKYLTASNQLTPAVEKEAKSFIRKGYQRELNYRRLDNSYAAFGDYSEAGSTFLTAFVVRSYGQAAEFVEIDENDLNVTLDWLRRIQEEDGHFRTVGYLAHKAMQGGVNNELTLAAYVMATFLELGFTLEDPTVSLAKGFIDSQLNNLEDAYAACLVAYTYALGGFSEFETVFGYLQSLAVEQEDMKHWESNRPGQPSYTSYYQTSARAQNIEMTAYVLRALLVSNHPDKLVEGSKIARWLVKQRNPRGGFQSTQDTVVAMTALAEFSELSTADTYNLGVSVSAADKSTVFDVVEDTKYDIQRISLESFPVTVEVSATGSGCALWQASVDFYEKKELKEVNPFILKASASGRGGRQKRDDHGEKTSCTKYRVTIQASYDGEDGGSNMALIQVRPMTGLVFNKESLKDLVKSVEEMKRYETEGDTVTFYFEEITEDEIEFSFMVDVNLQVEDPKPGLVTILDYYESDLSVSKELEFLCADEEVYAEPPDVDIITQMLSEPEESTKQPTTEPTTPYSPTSWPQSSTSAMPDVDECENEGVCGGPEYVCLNFPGTYECHCAEGYEYDELNDRCNEKQSCPVCTVDLPEGFGETYCAADYGYIMKVMSELGRVRLLNDLKTKTLYDSEKLFYDINMDSRCPPCALLTNAGDRIIIILKDSDISDKQINLGEGNIIVPNQAVIKKQLNRNRC